MTGVEPPGDPLLISMSGPDVVRIAVYPGDHQPGVSVEGTPEGAESNAWCILDSARLAYVKAGRPVPLRVRLALALLGTPADLVRA